MASSGAPHVPLQEEGVDEDVELAVPPPNSSAAERQTHCCASMVWYVVGLLAHSMFGFYVVALRMLQVDMRLPLFSLGFVLNTVAGMAAVMVFLPQDTLDWGILRDRWFWVFALTVVGRSTLNLVSSLFTQAAYVQMIYLSTPFFVAGIARCVYKERIPNITIITILLSTFGGAMMLSSNLFAVGFSELSNRDLIGLGASLLSALDVACYMLLIKKLAGYNNGTVFAAQSISAGLFSVVLSLVCQEAWLPWMDLSWLGLFLVVFCIVGVMIVGVNLQMLSIRRIGAAAVSSIMPWRLVVSLVGGALLLGERVTSPLQISGGVLVLFSVSFFLWMKNRAMKKNQRSPALAASVSWPAELGQEQGLRSQGHGR